MLRDWASLRKKYKSMNNWMHYVKNTGLKKLHYWESESYSGSWHAIGHTGPRFKDGITQG
jgi:hypothetical protein